jgi:Glutamine synthetase
MADFMLTYRLVVKEVAKQHGYHATFMPKPLFGENGSGCTRTSRSSPTATTVLRRGRQVAPVGRAKAFIAGQLRHARELSAVFAQWVNSYKRLVPGFEAPVYVAWSQRNRSA